MTAMLAQRIFAGLLVAGAVVYLARHAWTTWIRLVRARRGACGAACGCETDASGLESERR